MTETDLSVLERIEVEFSEEEDINHWACWDCSFSVCGDGGFNDDLGDISEEVKCKVCTLMGELDDFTPTPCKCCGSILWGIPLTQTPRTWSRNR